MTFLKAIKNFVVSITVILLTASIFSHLHYGDDFRLVSPAVIEWLKKNAVPFDTSDPGYHHHDLMFLKDMIGDARIVSLGEATHGTSEFFQMKHRILRFLVKEMGFTLFGIEATWPESNLVNDYVHSGMGDPAKLLAGLHFWTWNTQEVLDMILWMRSHNENPKGLPKVSFHGFDMQYPQMAMDNVVNYLKKVDPPEAQRAEFLYSCFRPYQNRPGDYINASAETKSECQKNVQEVYDLLKENQKKYEELSSTKEFAFALQSARIVIQGEDVFSGRYNPEGGRDRYMAENVTWLLEQSGPDSKIVLWAHNAHVSTAAYNYDPMGKFLREKYQEQMVIFGFSFFQGSFNAVSYSFRTRQYGYKIVHQASIPTEDSYEYRLRLADMPFLFLDLRGIDFYSEAAGWLAGPLNFRSIGAIYDDSTPLMFFSRKELPKEFDVIIYFQDTSPSILLPFY